jgi:hypothetical protein
MKTARLVQIEAQPRFSSSSALGLAGTELTTAAGTLPFVFSFPCSTSLELMLYSSLFPNVPWGTSILAGLKPMTGILDRNSREEQITLTELFWILLVKVKLRPQSDRNKLTYLHAIAKLANIGLSLICPLSGYNNPAATGRAHKLYTKAQTKLNLTR